MLRTALVFLVALIVAGGAGYFAIGYLQGGLEQERQEEQVAFGPLEPPLDVKFEVVLNDFLRKVQRQAYDYRLQRKALTEMVKPVNLRDPAYVEENYEMMTALVPELQGRIEALMQEFEVAGQAVETLLEGQPQETQQAIREKWRVLKNEQAAAYVDFFAVEQDLLAAYEDLMRFYHERRGRMQVDVFAGTVSFESPEDEALKEQKLTQIRDLSREQEAVLQK